MKDETIISLVAINAIVALDVYALSLGFNGTGVALAIAGIAGIAGYELKDVLEKVKGIKKA